MRAECVVGAGGRYCYLEEHESGNGAAPLPSRKLDSSPLQRSCQKSGEHMREKIV